MNNREIPGEKFRYEHKKGDSLHFTVKYFDDARDCW
jgi:hypothetical protein